MEEEYHNWKSLDHVSTLIEQARRDLSEYNDKSAIALNLFLDRNYGFIIKTSEVLNVADHNLLNEYLVKQLTDYGYKVTRSQGDETLLQASVRDRVHGKQLFGTIKVVNKKYEVRILVTPYIDSSYNEALKRRELIDVLFS